MTDNPHQFTHDAWEANAEVWDSRMGNDFFNIKCAPNFGKTLLTYMLHAIMHIKSIVHPTVPAPIWSCDDGYEESTPIPRIRVDIPTNGSSAFVVGSRTGGAV